MRQILAILLAAPAIAFASGPALVLDRAPVDLHNNDSLQRGAQVFVNHCLNCHSASAMRYARLTDIGLTEQQIKDNLMFTTDKVGETMKATMEPATAKAAFGVVPPDLSLAARSRSPDWIYTYLRTFYRDPASRTGWNNSTFPNVAMPHVLWQQQGDQALQVTRRTDENGDVHETRKLVLDRKGSLSAVEYDRYVGDLVNFMAYMAEPGRASRHQWGVPVLFFLVIFIVLTVLLKKEYWKDVR